MPMASISPSVHYISYKTTKHTISLSQKSTPTSQPPSPLSNPQIFLPLVKVTMNIKKHKVLYRARSLDGSATIADQDVSASLPSRTQVRFFDIVTFFVSKTAEDAIHEMLACMIVASSKRDFLARYLSRFAHRAVADAGKKLIDELELAFDFELEEVWEYDTARITAAVIKKSIRSAPFWPFLGFEENGCGEEREFPASCPVCLEDFFFPGCMEHELVCTPCFHVFHQPCIAGWFKDTCPLCRSKI